MSKYDELCAAHRQSVRETFQYRERAMLFVSRLLTGFVSYLGAPPERVEYLPPEPRDSNMIYNALGAATLQDDGWWDAYVRLTLLNPERKAIFLFRTLVEPDKYTVRVGDSKQTHMIPVGGEPTLEPIYEEAYGGARSYFTEGLQRFLDEASKSNVARKIGF